MSSTTYSPMRRGPNLTGSDQGVADSLGRLPNINNPDSYPGYAMPGRTGKE
jgi:hypothetical protein